MVQYKITEDDYVDVMRLVWSRSTKEKVFFGFVGCILGVLALYNLYNKPDNLSSFALLVILIVCFSLPHIAPLFARYTYRKYQKDIGQLRNIELTEDGLIFMTADAKELVRWEKIKRWRQDDKFILVYIMPQIIHTVPKALQDQGFDMEKLTVALEGIVRK